MAVYRNIAAFQVTGAVNANITGIIAVSTNDSTPEIKVGYDNIAAFEKYNGGAEFNGQLEIIDPANVSALALQNNCAVSMIFPKISGSGNVTVPLTGVRFGQTGSNERYGAETTFAMPMSGGLVGSPT